jgi:DNA-directed RNA polymerase specialized sigma24 family protein
MHAPWPEDAVQSAALALTEEVHCGSIFYGVGYSLKSYAGRVVANKVCDQFREKRGVEVDPDAVVTNVTPEAQYEAEDKRRRQRQVLRELPRKHRKQVGGIAKHGTQAAYAAAAELPQQTVSSQFAKLREILRRRLRAEEALVIAWFARRRWTVAISSVAAAIVIFLVLPRPEPTCRVTAGDDYALEYSGQCAIGFKDVEHPELRSVASPIPGVIMLLDGTARIHLAAVATAVDGGEIPEIPISGVPKRGGTPYEWQAFVTVGESSYVVMVNRNDTTVRYCMGATCSDVASGEYTRGGAPSWRSKFPPASLEGSLLESAKRPLIPSGTITSYNMTLRGIAGANPITWGSEVMKGWSVSLNDDHVSFANAPRKPSRRQRGTP